MRRPVSTGSTFRTNTVQELTTKDMEAVIVNSGLLGKKPSQHEIKYTQPSQVEYKPPPDICIPSGTTTRLASIKRPKTAVARVPPPKTPRRATVTRNIEPQLPEPTPASIPFVYYGKILGASEPPAANNFEQLNEILERLISEEGANEWKIHGNLFGEVIRQYCVECAAQGEILSDCRDYFVYASDKILQIRHHYDSIVAEVEKEIKANKDAMVPVTEELEKARKRKEELIKFIEDLKKTLDALKSRYDEMVSRIAAATKELAQMRELLNQIEDKLARKNARLLELIEQLRILSSIASSYTNDSLKFAENLAEVRRQQNEAAITIKEAQEIVEQYKTNIALIDKEIGELTEALEQSRIKPETADVEAQIDLISRRLFKTTNVEEELVQRQAGKAPGFDGSLWEKIKKEYGLQTGKGKNIENLTIQSYEDYAKLKKIVLKHEQEFRLSPELVRAGETGDFELEPNDLDLKGLYAASLMSQIMQRAISQPVHKRVETQTVVPRRRVKEENKELQRIMKESRLIALVGTDFSHRSPQQLKWIIKNIREIYDAKALADEHALANGKRIMPFPEFIISYAKEQFKLQFLCDQFCWDIYLTSHEHKTRTQEIEIFVAFLDEKMTTEQLAFFLIARADCLNVGSAVSLYTRDGLETYNEYYIDVEQMELLMPLWWSDRLKQKYIDSITELSVSRPAVHLEATKRYLAMHDILIKLVIFYAEDSVARLSEMLKLYRLKPRPTKEQFETIMRKMVKVLTDQDLEELYRSTILKSVERENISAKKFIRNFEATSLLVKRRKYEYEENQDIELNIAVEEQWNLMKADLERVFEFFRAQQALQPDNLTLKTYFDDAVRYHSNLIHAMALNNGKISSMQFYQFLFALDASFSAISSVTEDQETLISMECAIRETWMDTVF